MRLALAALALAALASVATASPSVEGVSLRGTPAENEIEKEVAAGKGTVAKQEGAAKSERAEDARSAAAGILRDRFVLQKRFDLAKHPGEDFDVGVQPDENLTHSCSNYIDDGSTVFTRDKQLVLRVASHCDGGGCVNSGRVMSKESFKYGLFTFSAKVPKCNYIWPALWLLPEDVNGHGAYGRWPCSGEIDVLETVHDQNFGTFNIVAGFGCTGGCTTKAATSCNQCMPDYCTSTTMSSISTRDRYFIEDVDCDATHPSWSEHTFVLNWQPGELTTWVDPVLSYDAEGRLVSVKPKPAPAVAGVQPTWRTYQRPSTPTWLAVGDFMNQCFPGKASSDAPFDDGMKLVLNIAVGGYGGAPCSWGERTCQTACGGAIGSELVLSDIAVWQRMA